MAPLHPCHPPPAFTPPVPNSVSFWTSCPSCRMLLEYQRIFVLKNLCCPLCYKPFIAKEVLAVSGTLLWPPPSKQQHYRTNSFTNGSEDSSHANNDGFPSSQFGSFPFGKAGLGQAAYLVPNNNVQRKEKAEAQVHSRKLTPENQKKVEERIRGVQAKLERYSMEAQAQDSDEPKQKISKKNMKDELKAKAAVQAKEVFNKLIARSKGVIEQKLSEDKERKAKMGIVEQVRKPNGVEQSEKPDNVESIARPDDMKPLPKPGISIASVSKPSPRQTATSSSSNGYDKNSGDPQGKQVPSGKTKSTSPPKGKRAATTLDHETHDASSSAKKVKEDPSARSNGDLGTSQEVQVSSEPPQDVVNKGSPRALKGMSSSESTAQASSMDLNILPMVDDDAITVPDSEFYDFDKDRTEADFLAGQIWAVYDDGDSMPRYYARINKVFSLEPFKIQIAWLEARASSDEALAWLDAGLSLTCGEFRLGKSTTTELINMFSHAMKYEKGQRGVFKIFPQEGDIWALYTDCDHAKVQNGKAGYEVVEVLKGFEEAAEEGVQVCPLSKLDGFKTLFQRQAEEKRLEWIRTQDLHRFSHLVPAYRLKAEQLPGTMEACWELDPASTPEIYVI